MNSEQIGLIAGVVVQLTMAAVIVERVVEFFVKPRLPEKYKGLTVYVAIVLGLLLALNYGLDAMVPLGFSASVTWLGKLLTGVIIGGGTTFVHDLFAQAEAKKQALQSSAVKDAAIAEAQK